MTAQDQRAAAALRRQAAEQAGERGGQGAFDARRRLVSGVGQARRLPMKTELKAETVEKGGKELIHTSGYFTRYAVAYPMWDEFGEYEESVARGAGSKTLASKPDVTFLVNHTGISMARTVSGTLMLEERADGGWHDAYLNPKRNDVHDLVVALDDGAVDQMSFAFMVPDNAGLWSEDFMHFEIRQYDINRGDVSAVNYGANPYTDISARTAEVLNDLMHLPQGALRAAEDRLIRRGLSRPVADSVRERIEVSAANTNTMTTAAGSAPAEPRFEPTLIAGQGSSSRAVQRLSAHVSSSAARYLAYARERSPETADQLAELMATKLPWFDVRNAAGEAPEESEAEDVATVYVYDEIGGSFGVDAEAFALALDEIQVPKIALRINSPGGSVFQGTTIHSSLLHHPAKVRTYVDGLAASAASVIAMAADPLEGEGDDEWGGIVMMPGSEMMIHDASMNGSGTAADWQSGSVYLDRSSANLATMYSARAGGTPEEWRERMLAETWLFGQEAVDLNLADKVYERNFPTRSADMQERMARRWDVSGRYRYNRRAGAPDPMLRVTVKPRMQVRTAASDRTGSVVDPRPVVADQAGDRQNKPMGRSIALIEAELAIDED